VSPLNPSCPDWKVLAAHRRERHGAEPEGWREALKHLDGCAPCRAAAAAADPTLLFRRLAKVERPPVDEAAEAEAVLQAVTAMRTADRIGRIGRVTASARPRRAGWRAWRRHAAAAVLMVAALPLGGDDGWRMRLGGETMFLDSLNQEVSQPAAGAPSGVELDQPLIENLNRPEARVYEINSQDFGFVMVVDESFEV